MTSLKPDCRTFKDLSRILHPTNQSSRIMKKTINANCLINPFLANQEAEQSRKQVQSRSEKSNSETNLEISFEKGILESHKRAIENIFLRYTEKLTQILNNSHIKFINKEEKNTSQEQENENNKLKTVIQQCPYFQKRYKVQLIEDLKNQTQFKDLFIFTYNKVQETIKSDVCFLFAFLWQQYIIFNKDHHLRQKVKVQKIKKSITQQIHQLVELKQLQNITLLQSHKTDIQIIKNYFLWLLHSLAQTITLVIDGYFDNPLQQVQDIGEDDILSNIRRLSWLSLEDSDEEQANIEYLSNNEPLKKVKRC